MVEPLADRVLALTLADEPGQLAALLLDRPRWEGPLDVGSCSWHACGMDRTRLKRIRS